MTFDKKAIKEVVKYGSILLLLVLISPVNISQSVINGNYTETFEVSSTEELTNWIFKGYNLDSSNVYHEIQHEFTINNGKLLAPDKTAFSPLQRAMFNSSIAYGSWNFDWVASKNNQSYDAIEFIFTDNEFNYDLDGATFLQTNYSGYSLIIDSFNYEFGPGIQLIKFGMGNPHYVVLATYHSSILSGLYHFNITRDLTGLITVEMNSNKIIEATENTYLSSEKFSFTSFQGNSSIDNISISELTTSETTSQTDGFVFVVFSFSLIIMAIIRKNGFKK